MPTDRQRYFLNSFLMTLFLFLLGGNLLGLIPGLHSPTNTLNTDLGLAVIVFFIVQSWAFIAKGGAGFKRLIHGGAMGWGMLPITILEEFAKPITLSMRLYGNIFAGELIILVIIGLLHYVGAIISPFWYAFSIFVGAVQAFLFMVLTLAYVGQTTTDEEGH
jgi:F-type H+-transporting ATPase subunit a